MSCACLCQPNPFERLSRDRRSSAFTTDAYVHTGDVHFDCDELSSHETFATQDEKKTMTTAQSRINMRVSPEALEQIREAAKLQNQDLTAFVLGSAMSNARQVLLEDRVLKLTPAEVLQIEQALESDAAPSQRLIDAFARHRPASASD